MGIAIIVLVIMGCVFFYKYKEFQQSLKQPPTESENIQTNEKPSVDENDNLLRKYENSPLFKMCFERVYNIVKAKLESIGDTYYHKTEISRYDCDIFNSSLSLCAYSKESPIAPGVFGWDEVLTIDFNEKGYQLTDEQVVEFSSAMKTKLEKKLSQDFSQIKVDMHRSIHGGDEEFWNIELFIMDCYKKSKDIFSE